MVIVRAPVRISFGGGGTDLEAYYGRFGGLVVSAAITHYAYVAATTPADRSVGFHSADYGAVERYRPGEKPLVTEPLTLPKAAVEAFWDRGIGNNGIDLYTACEVPPGSGLGSSSAMAVALCAALSAHTGISCDARSLADLACRLEIERLGMPIGKQDQYASACGGLNTIEFAADGVRVVPLRLPADTISALASRLLLFSTCRTRDSAGILRQQRADTATNAAVIASLHEIKALALEMRAALIARDLDGFGRLLHRAWERKRSLSRNISSAAIDASYEAAREAGALGGKITGAGGGGFLLLYVPPTRQRRVRSALTAMGLRELPFAFDFTGLDVLDPSSPDVARALARLSPDTHYARLRPAPGRAPVAPGP